MKQDIHPKYFSKAVVTCSCGATHKLGSTKEAMAVEICSECHPFYTGKEKLVDTAGRVEKFKTRQVKAKAVKEATASKNKAPKKKNTANKKVTPKTTAKKKQ